MPTAKNTFMFNSQKNRDIHRRIYLNEREMAYYLLYLSCLIDRILFSVFPLADYISCFVSFFW